MKEEEIEKGNCGATPKSPEDGPVVYLANAFDSRLWDD